MADTTTDTTDAYEQVKTMLEMEIQRLDAFLELQSVLRDMRAWLDGDDTTTDGKEGA